MMKTVNRGWLLRMAQAGRLWVRCRYHYTDDYAFDAAYNFGKMDNFSLALIAPEFKKPEGSESWDYRDEQAWYSRVKSDWRQSVGIGMLATPDRMEFHAHDLQGHGRAYSETGDKYKGTIRVHSNLVYDYEVRDAQAIAA